MLTQEQAAQALQQAGVSVFNLVYDGVGVQGTVATEADRQKAISALGRINGTPVADYLQVQQSGGASAGQSYTVKSGDNLRKIAEQFYGDEMKWHAIRDANPELAANPDKISVGQKLTIPGA
jgi:nucleoid-associated protein YgaU